MAFKIFPFLLSVFILGHVVCDDKCFNDKNQLVPIPAINDDGLVITLQSGKTCSVLCNNPKYNFDPAEEKCKKFVDGSMMSSKNFNILKSVIGVYPVPSRGSWFIEKNGDNCQVIENQKTGPIISESKCLDLNGFACQYPFQYNCAWEIRAVVKNDQIVYETVLSQNSDADHSKSCTPKIPPPVDCPGANLNPWSSWGDCSKSCTKKDGDPPMMHETREATCSGKKITVYRNKTCKTDTLCAKDKEDIPYLAIVLIVLFVFVLLTVVFVAFFCYLRKKKIARATAANEPVKSGKDDHDDVASKRAESKNSPKKRKKSAIKTTSFAKSDEHFLVANILNAKTTVTKL